MTQTQARVEAEEFGLRLRRAIRAVMAANGITGARLAEMVNVSNTALSDRLNGKRKLSDVELAEIAVALKLSMTELVELADEAAFNKRDNPSGAIGIDAALDRFTARDRNRDYSEGDTAAAYAAVVPRAA